MNSNDLKFAAIQWLRYHKQLSYICTEFSWDGVADVVGACSKFSYEIECKISKSDFTSDFNKPKHSSFSLGNGPTYFYFLVIPQIADYCHKYLNGEDKFYTRYGAKTKIPLKKYGLMTLSESQHGMESPIRVIRPAKKICEEEIPEGFLKAILKRMGSELVLNWFKYKKAMDTQIDCQKYFDRWEKIMDGNKNET